MFITMDIMMSQSSQNRPDPTIKTLPMMRIVTMMRDVIPKEMETPRSVFVMVFGSVPHATMVPFVDAGQCQSVWDQAPFVLPRGIDSLRTSLGLQLAVMQTFIAAEYVSSPQRQLISVAEHDDLATLDFMQSSCVGKRGQSA